jgi:hypothetical protein
MYFKSTLYRHTTMSYRLFENIPSYDVHCLVCYEQIFTLMLIAT